MSYGAPPQGIAAAAPQIILDDDVIEGIYGTDVYNLYLTLVRGGAKILGTAYRTPSMTPIATETYSNFASPSITREYYGYRLSGYSSDGNDAHGVWWFFDISSYNEILVLARLMCPDEGRGPYISLGVDVYNAYLLLIGLLVAGLDFRLEKHINGTPTTLAAESVDLQFNTPYAVAWYYNRSSGEHIVWRDGVQKFDVIDTDISPQKLGFGFWTKSTVTTYRDIMVPIVVVAK